MSSASSLGAANLHTQLPTCLLCLPTLRTSLSSPAAAVTGRLAPAPAAATFSLLTCLTLTVLWWELDRERLDGARGTTFDPAVAANQTCCSHLHRPFQTREPSEQATPPPLAASCPVLRCFVSVCHHHPWHAMAVLPFISLSLSLSPPPPLPLPLPPSSSSLHRPAGW